MSVVLLLLLCFHVELHLVALGDKYLEANRHVFSHNENISRQAELLTLFYHHHIKYNLKTQICWSLSPPLTFR